MAHHTERSEFSYVAHPLSNPRHIRVLDIFSSPYSFESSVECTMRVISIDDPQEKYQTLSYAWGCPERTRIILCDGKPFKVTKNLDQALRRIREKIFTKDVFSSTIWIDAISINQDNGDDSEKNKQVAMMGDIYKNSSRLIIWLGEASKTEIDSTQAAIKHPKDANSPAILQRLTSRPWFERLWVVQEVFNSARASRHVLLGNLRCTFDWIIKGCRDANILADSPSLLRVWLPELYVGNGTMLYNQSEERRDLLPTLVENMLGLLKAKVSLPRDRVFSMLGISDPQTKVPVDYEADFAALCIGLARTHIASRISFRSLLMCATALRLDQKIAPELPSWTPDWRVTATVLESDPQKLRNFESDLINDHRRQGPHVGMTEQNVLTVDAILYESTCMVYGGNKLLCACDRCPKVENAAYVATWVPSKGWNHNVDCGNLVVFHPFGHGFGVIFSATVIGLDQKDILDVTLESYCTWPDAYSHHWFHHYRQQRQPIRIH